MTRLRRAAHWAGGFALLGAASLLVGCDRDEAPGDVFGSWCGKRVSSRTACTGDEVHYVEIAPAEGGTVTGVHCEAYGKECYTLIDTEHTGESLRYAYEFSLSRVEAELELTGGGETLEGVLTSTKCGNCQTPITLFRIPE